MTTTITPNLSARLSRAGWRKMPMQKNLLYTGKTQYTLRWDNPDGRSLIQRDNVDADGAITSKQTIMIEANGATSINFGTPTLVAADAALLTQFNL